MAGQEARRLRRNPEVPADWLSHMRAWAILAILTTVTLAGCASSGPADEQDLPVDPVYDLGDLSQKVFDILPVVEEWVAMDDGKRMHNAVYRPDTNESVPVFINFSPYWGDTAETGGDAFSQYMINEYVPRGYAVVLTGIRGTGHSEGCFSIGGDRELQDLHQVVDHYANIEWSNGNIAAGGKSYDSTPTNGMIAKFPHPALKGVFHVSGISDMYAYNYKGGVPYATGPVFNTYYYAQGTDEYGVSLVGAGTTADEDPESLARLIDDVACPDLPFVQAHGVGSGVTGMKTDYWQERDWTQFIGDSEWNGSIFFVHGLQDWNVKPDHILPWIDNLPEQIRVKGWLHQGAHVYPERTDWNQTMLRWMDHELKGIDTGLWGEPQWDVRSDNGLWYQEDAWPPEPITWGGFSDGSAVLLTANETLRLSGSIQINVVAYGAPDGVVVASFYDQAPDGTRTWVSEAVLRTLYADGLDNPQPLVGNVEMSLASYPFDHVFEAGHSVVVEFQGDSRNAVVLPSQTAGTMVMLLGEYLLPVSHAVPVAEQPKDMECFAC